MYWLEREQEGAVVECSRDVITCAIERWNKSNRPKLILPD
jgi:hypothetical protein